MNSTVLQRRRVERFAQLLDEASGARRHHAKAAIDDETSSLVSIGQALTAATPEVHIREEFRRDTRAFLMAAAERDGIGRTAVAQANAQSSNTRFAQPAVGRAQVSADGTVPSGPRSLLPKSLSPRRKAPSQSVTTGRGRARGAILVGLAVGTLALSGISAASGNAQPGDTLYNLKLQEENAQLALAGSDVSKGQVYLKLAQTRMNEAGGVRSNADLLSQVLGRMDDETAAGATLLFNDAIKHRDADDLKTVTTFVTAQETQIEQLLQGLPDGPRRNRILGSESRIDLVQTRADSIQSAWVNCTTTVTKPGNNLGKELVCKESTTVTPNSAPSSKSGGKGTVTKPDSHSSSSSSSPSSSASSSSSSSTTTPHSTATPASTPAAPSNNDAVVTPTQSPTSDGGLLGDVSKLLGGL